MTPRGLGEVLARFGVAWPWMEPTDLTATVWAEQMTTVDDDLGLLVAKRLTASEERPPTIARFLAEVLKVRHDQHVKLNPGPAVPHDRAESSRALGAIRAGMAVAAKEVPLHRDHDRAGGSRCPACSTRSERMDGNNHRAVPEIMTAIRESLTVPADLPGEQG